MRYRYIHILAALFLIVGMGVQLFVSYRQASQSVLKQLLEQFKPFDGAICIFYSSDGTLLTASDELKEIDPATLTQENWLFSRLTLSPIDITQQSFIHHSHA